jgi:hypothetical protein
LTVIALLTATAAIALLAGGCASNSSRDWAQNSPIIQPSESGQPVISLGAVERGS